MKVSHRTPKQRVVKPKPGYDERSAKADELFMSSVEHLAHRSPDELADIVRKARLRGRPHTSYQCPIAKLLDMQCGVHTNVIGVGKKFIIRNYPQRGKSRFVKVPTPKSIAQFLVRFDTGDYPELFAPPPRAVKGVKSTWKDPRKGGDRHKKGYKPPVQMVKRDLVGMLGGRGQLVRH